jgi:hypothetical protein
VAPPGETTLRRIRVLGRSWTVSMGPGGLRLDADGRTLLASDAPVVLRNLDLGEDHLACDTYSSRPVVLRLQHPAPPGRLVVDGAERAPGASGIELFAGIHTIRAVTPRS